MAINLLGLRLSRHRTISPCQTPIDLLILIDDSFGGAIIWWRDDRETTNLIHRAVGNSQMAFFYFSSTTKDAQEEFFTAFIRVYIKYIASLYHTFNSQTVKLKRNFSTFHLQRILISRKIPLTL